MTYVTGEQRTMKYFKNAKPEGAYTHRYQKLDPSAAYLIEHRIIIRLINSLFFEEIKLSYTLAYQYASQQSPTVHFCVLHGSTCFSENFVRSWG